MLLSTLERYRRKISFSIEIGKKIIIAPSLPPSTEFNKEKHIRTLMLTRAHMVTRQSYASSLLKRWYVLATTCSLTWFPASDNLIYHWMYAPGKYVNDLWFSIIRYRQDYIGSCMIVLTFKAETTMRMKQRWMNRKEKVEETKKERSLR